MEQQSEDRQTGYRRIELGKLLKEYKPSAARWVPRWLIRSLERLLHLDEINDLLAGHFADEPMEFVHAVNSFLGISMEMYGEDRLVSSIHDRPIFVANHPLGGPESLVLLEAVGKLGADVRMVAKSVLTAVKPLAPLLTPIPTRAVRSSCDDFKSDFSSDIPIVMFPAGYCSRPLSNGDIFDYQWFPTCVKMARRTGRPIIPIHIAGENSKRFYRWSALRRRLGIKTSLESLLLPDEMFKQKGKVVRLTVGNRIDTRLLTDANSDWYWADVLRNHVFALGKSPDVPFDPEAKPMLPLT